MRSKLTFLCCSVLFSAAVLPRESHAFDLPRLVRKLVRRIGASELIAKEWRPTVVEGRHRAAAVIHLLKHNKISSDAVVGTITTWKTKTDLSARQLEALYAGDKLGTPRSRMDGNKLRSYAVYFDLAQCTADGGIRVVSYMAAPFSSMIDFRSEHAVSSLISGRKLSEFAWQADRDGDFGALRRISSTW